MHGVRVVSRKEHLRTLRIRRPDRVQRPEMSLRNTFICVPDVVDRQINVLPGQRRYVRKERFVYRAVLSHRINCILQIDGIPQRGCGDEIQLARTVALVFV